MSWIVRRYWLRLSPEDRSVRSDFASSWYSWPARLSSQSDIPVSRSVRGNAGCRLGSRSAAWYWTEWRRFLLPGRPDSGPMPFGWPLLLLGSKARSPGYICRKGPRCGIIPHWSSCRSSKPCAFPAYRSHSINGHSIGLAYRYWSKPDIYLSRWTFRSLSRKRYSFPSGCPKGWGRYPVR